MKRKKTKLSDKQKRFAQEYLVDLNAMQAAIRAGYSKASAGTTSARLMGDDRIQRLVAKGQAKCAEMLELNQERIALEFMRIAFADMARIASWDDERVYFKDSARLSESDTRAVESITQTKHTDGSIRMQVKLHNKVKALDSLARHLGMFVDRTEHDVKITDITELVRQAAEDYRKKR